MDPTQLEALTPAEVLRLASSIVVGMTMLMAAIASYFLERRHGQRPLFALTLGLIGWVMLTLGSAVSEFCVSTASGPVSFSVSSLGKAELSVSVGAVSFERVPHPAATSSTTGQRDREQEKGFINATFGGNLLYLR